MIKLRIPKFYFYFFVVILCTFISKAQTTTTMNLKKDVPSTCEYIMHTIDYSIINNDKDSKLILIFHLGKNESSNVLNNMRIKSIKKYIERNTYLQQTVFATGEKTNDLGELEIYVKGKLYERLFFVEGDKNKICIE